MDDENESRKDERRRRRAEAREEEIVEAVQAFEVLEGHGLDPLVDKSGRFHVTAMETPDMPVETFVERAGAWHPLYEDLLELNNTEDGREILREAWERFQDEED